MTASSHRIVLISRDQGLGAGFLAAARGARGATVDVVPAAITEIASVGAIDGAAVVVADLDARSHDELVGLQQLMSRLGGATPVIVLTDSFDEAVGRWFLQIRISDFLRKPVQANELLKICQKTLSGPVSEQPTEIITFVPAQGGVGNTTVAVETAMQMVTNGGSQSRGVCLVDLDFQNDACAAYLDIEPRLDFHEIGVNGERLDTQLLDIMTMRHSSGLALLASPAQPGQEARISTDALLRLLDTIASRYQHVIIDLPRTWQPWTDSILRGSDRVYVVTDMTVPGLRCARRMVQRIAERLDHEIEPKVIVNRLEKQSLFGGGLRRADVEKALDGCFAGGISNNYPVVREAIDRGVPLEVVKQGNSVSLDLKRIIFAA